MTTPVGRVAAASAPSAPASHHRQRLAVRERQEDRAWVKEKQYHRGSRHLRPVLSYEAVH